MSGWGPQVQNLDVEIIAHERPTIDCERRGKNELDDRPLGLPWSRAAFNTFRIESTFT